eukprot:9013646-Pyramimonas_sp.AAC.1
MEVLLPAASSQVTHARGPRSKRPPCSSMGNPAVTTSTNLRMTPWDVQNPNNTLFRRSDPA